MVVVFSCESCHSQLRAKESLIGRQFNCPKCSARVVVPDKGPSNQASPSAEKRVPAATDTQKDFARSLGLEFPEHIDRKSISKMIDDALANQEDARYARLEALQAGESEAREQLRAEVMAECDAEDPRISVASVKEIVEALSQREIGAIIVTFEFGAFNGVEDLTGAKFDINATDDLDQDDLKRLLGWLGMAMLR